MKSLTDWWIIKPGERRARAWPACTAPAVLLAPLKCPWECVDGRAGRSSSCCSSRCGTREEKEGSVARIPLHGPLSQTATGRCNSSRLEEEKILRKRGDKDRKGGQDGPQVTDKGESPGWFSTLCPSVCPLSLLSIRTITTSHYLIYDFILKAQMNLNHHLHSGSVCT